MEKTNRELKRTKEELRQVSIDLNNDMKELENEIHEEIHEQLNDTN